MISSKKPPAFPKRAKAPAQDPDDHELTAKNPFDSDPDSPEATHDSNGLLDGPRTPRGGFLSGSLTPRGRSGSLTPRGLGSLTPRALAGAPTPRGGGGHSFQRLD